MTDALAPVSINDVPQDATRAQAMLRSLVEGIQAMASSLNAMIQNGARTEAEAKAIAELAFQIGKNTDTIRAWSTLLMANEQPDATHTIKYAMRKWSTRTWRSGYEVYQDTKRHDPRLHDEEIRDGMAGLVREGWLKQSNIGGGRTQYRRLGE